MRSESLLYALIGTTLVVGTVVGMLSSLGRRWPHLFTLAAQVVGAGWLLLGATAVLAVRRWGADLIVLCCAAFLTLTSMVLLLNHQAQRTRARFRRPPRE